MKEQKRQGLELSPLLFIIVMDVIATEIKSGLPWEALYVDDLVLMAKSESAMESKGMKVNIVKTKVVLIDRECERESTGKFPCAVCQKGVGRYSILCMKCEKWTQKMQRGQRKLDTDNGIHLQQTSHRQRAAG